MPSLLTGLFRFVGHLCRLALAFVFLSAGFFKGLDPEGFAHEVGQYGLLQGAVAHLFAYVLIPLEVAVGVALLLNFRPVLSFSVAAALMLMFLGAVGYAIVTGQPLTDCGCFGRNLPRTPQQTLSEDLGLLAAAVVGLLASLRRAEASGASGGRRWKAPALLVTALSSGAFVIASPFLPIDDLVTALRPGVRWHDLNVALAEMDLGKDKHLVVIMGMQDSATADALEPLNRMAAAGRLSIVGLYADDDTAYNQFFWTRGPAFPLYHAAPSDLRPLHRRLPRFFTVKDGTVTATWETVPTEQQVEKALE